MADGSTFPALRIGRYDPNHPQVLAEIADFDGDRDSWEVDNTIACLCCGDRFYVGFPQSLEPFDKDIYERDRLLVCEDCAPSYVEEATYDPIREHGTYYAQNGSVVG